MLTVSNISLQYGKRVLFDQVNMTFSGSNCYGIIGANGAGKSTFLKILSKKIEPTSGAVSLEKNKRMSVLEQDHFAYDSVSVLNTVIIGNKTLYDTKKEMEDIYAKENFSDEDSERVGELQTLYEELNGWASESEAAILLSNLGISESSHHTLMANMDAKLKVRVLLAQALFGNPDVLIMDEPTNDLNFETIRWLEVFIANYENTVIVVSHDRHFLDTVCTDICDIDFSKINHFSGNYTFWYESSQLALKQKTQQNKKTEEKAKELQDFIRRFSANVAKSKQATSRKKMLDKLNIESIKPSTRRYPGIIFEKERDLGNQILTVDDLSATSTEGDILFKSINFTLKKNDKVIFLSKNSKALAIFYDILTNNHTNFSGKFEWGITTSTAYLPLENANYFNNNLSLVDWLAQYAKTNKKREEIYLRGFLGKMLFSGEEALKKSNVLSGGEKVRCIISQMMMKRSNVLLLNEPTSHLDLESITAFNNALKNFKGIVLLSTQDHHFAQSIGNRVIEITPKGTIDKMMAFEEYMNDEALKKIRHAHYK